MTDTTPDTTPEADTATAEAAEIHTAPTDPADGPDAAGPTDTGENGDNGDNGDTETPPTNREARYRRRLRETESERDQLAERLAVVQRGEAERLAAAVLGDGADLWRDGADVTAVLDADGNIDAAKVNELATATAAAHPHWRRIAAPRGIRRELNASGAIGTGDRVDTTWASVLRGANR